MSKQGIIIKGISGKYTVYTEGTHLECVAKGVFRKQKITPLPGDTVTVEDGVIVAISPRKNQLIRPAVANVDQIAVFVPVKSPEPDYFLLDKMLLTAFEHHIDVLICVNKCDCDEAQVASYIQQAYGKLPVKVLCMEAVNGIGIAEISEFLTGKITVLAGQSGAGKSTTVNGVFGQKKMETGVVSMKTERGKHTTRHAELFLLEGKEGFLIDTPGFSSHDLPDYDAAMLRGLYPEFAAHEGTCRFKECLHWNEPNCAVKAAVERGEIDAGRYQRYLRYQQEIAVRKANKYK